MTNRKRPHALSHWSIGGDSQPLESRRFMVRGVWPNNTSQARRAASAESGPVLHSIRCEGGTEAPSRRCLEQLGHVLVIHSFYPCPV